MACKRCPIHIPVCTPSNEEYGFVFTPNTGLTLASVPPTGLLFPGTSIPIPGLATDSLAAVIPWTNNDVLVNVSRLPYSARIRREGNISLTYTFTPTLTLTFPEPFDFSLLPNLLLTTISMRAALYAITDSTATEIPGTRQIITLGITALFGIAFGLLMSVTPPFTLAFPFPLEIVGQGLTHLASNTQIALVVNTYFSNVTIPVSNLPILNFVASDGTLASLKIEREENKPAQPSCTTGSIIF